jgi:hypothetical protein
MMRGNPQTRLFNMGPKMGRRTHTPVPVDRNELIAVIDQTNPDESTGKVQPDPKMFVHSQIETMTSRSIGK